MSTIKAESFAAIAGQVFDTEFIAYTTTAIGYDMLALPAIWVHLGGKHVLEYVTFNEVSHRVEIRCDGMSFDNTPTDNEPISRVLADACKRIETTLATLIAV